MAERQREKGPVRYDYQVFFEDDDDSDEKLSLLIDSWVLLHTHSDEETEETRECKRDEREHKQDERECTEDKRKHKDEETRQQKDDESVSDVGISSQNNMQVDEPAPMSCSSPTSQALPYTSTREEEKVISTVVCSPNTSYTVFKPKTDIPSDESSLELPPLLAAVSLPSTSVSAGTQVMNDEAISELTALNETLPLLDEASQELQALNESSNLPALNEDTTELPALNEDTTELPTLNEDTSELPALSEDTSELPALNEDTTELPTLNEAIPELPALNECIPELPALNEASPPLNEASPPFNEVLPSLSKASPPLNEALLPFSEALKLSPINAISEETKAMDNEYRTQETIEALPSTSCETTPTKDVLLPFVAPLFKSHNSPLTSSAGNNGDDTDDQLPSLGAQHKSKVLFTGSERSNSKVEVAEPSTKSNSKVKGSKPSRDVSSSHSCASRMRRKDSATSPHTPQNIPRASSSHQSTSTSKVSACVDSRGRFIKALNTLLTCKQTSSHTAAAGGTQQIHGGLPSVSSSPEATQSLPHALTSPQTREKQYGSPPPSSSLLNSKTLPITVTPGRTQVTHDDLPSLGASPSTTRFSSPYASTSVRRKIRKAEPIEGLPLPHNDTSPVESKQNTWAKIKSKGVTGAFIEPRKEPSFNKGCSSDSFCTRDKFVIESSNFTLPRRVNSNISTASSSVEVNVKKKLPDAGVIYISDDESESDGDVVCLEPHKCSKPLYICETKNSESKKDLVERFNLPCDLTIIKDLATTSSPRKTKRNAMTPNINQNPDIVVDKVVCKDFYSNTVSLNIGSHRKKRVQSRELFIKDKQDKYVRVEKTFVKDIPLLRIGQ